VKTEETWIEQTANQCCTCNYTAIMRLSPTTRIVIRSSISPNTPNNYAKHTFTHSSEDFINGTFQRKISCTMV